MPRFGENQYRAGDCQRGREFAQNVYVNDELNEESDTGERF